MRAYLPSYELVAGSNLDDVLAMLADPSGGWQPFAGGTDLMVVLETGRLPAGKFVSLWGIEELRGIDVAADVITLGALTTYAEVMHHEVLAREFPLLRQAASETGGVATQNRGTLGGNIANASPAADTPPALLVYDAELELISSRGTRRVAYDTFHTGYKQTVLEHGEIIRAIRLPRGRRGWVETFRKVGTRRAQAISKVCVAAAARMDAGAVADVRFAVGSVAPTVVRCRHVEDAIRGRQLDAAVAARAEKGLLRDIAPIDDVRSTAHYRLRVAQNLLSDFLASL